MEEKILKRMIRMACDAILTMDKLAGYPDVTLQNRLIRNYSIYFHMDLSQELLQVAINTINGRMKEEKNGVNKMLLLRCREYWFTNKNKEAFL